MADVKPEKVEKLEDGVLDEDEAGDDPNEYLDVHPSLLDSSVWLIKVPKGLASKWAAVKEDGIPLATMRIYTKPDGSTSKITVRLPEQPQYDAGDEPKDWEFALEPGTVHSQYIMSDKPKVGAVQKRARITSIKGKATIRGKMLRSTLTEEYGAKMRQRVEAVKPKRHIKILTDAALNQAGSNLKMLQSGAMQTNAGFNTQYGRPVANASSSNRSSDKQPFERAARISRDELLDLLFTIFTAEQPFWSLKDLKRRTAQPEAYLKQILGDIADFHRHGANTNMFSLKAGFGSAGPSMAKSEAGPSTSTAVSTKMEEDEDDDDDDDDEEMEEIS